MNYTFRQHRALLQRIEHLREHDSRSLATTLRATLGRDLSDLCSNLTALRQQLGHGSPGSALLDDLDATAEHAQQELRRLLHTIQPPGTEDLGLIPALERCVADFTDHAGAVANMQFTSRLPALSQAKQAMLHLALKESLANVARHARARRVDIWLAADPCIVQLKVCDDGVGMTSTDCRKPGTLGLFCLHEKLASLGGSLRVTGSRGEGTLVDVSVPVAQAARSDANAWNHVPYDFTEAGVGEIGVAQGA